jgi:Zn finger protein HypA/HybF involved in hydrogenase expression
MALSLPCNNTYLDDQKRQRRCGTVEVYMDKNTEKVYCPLCHNEMPNINHFTKITLKNLKQYAPKSTATFMVKCQKCSVEAQPVSCNGEIVCAACKRPHQHLTEPFKLMLKDQLKTMNTIL